jgi:putative serine protease PepD
VALVTSIRVRTKSQSYVFPPVAPVVIGSSNDSHIVLTAPLISRHHIRLVPDGNAWQLVDESVSGTWIAGDRVGSLPVTGPLTAFLGSPRGETTIHLEPVATAEAAAASVAGAPAQSAEIRTGPVGGPDSGPAPGRVAQQPVLVTQLGGQQQIFPVGATVRVGRDPTAELVSASPLVSRHCHGLIVSDENSATYTDKSRRGTFLDGKPLRGPLRITHSVVLRLGDPATGEELGITPPLTTSQLARNRNRKILGGRVRVGALAAVVIAAVGALASVLVTTLGAAHSTRPPVTGLSAASLRHAETATVRLLMGSPTDYSGWGSGTLISSDGLILTNAHVAEPRAAGAAVMAGVPSGQLPPDPPFLTVELIDGQSSAAVARYRARPVAVDGYLDLAVVRIYATSSGRPVAPASLHLPHLALGDVASLQLDQTVTVLGFPGVSGSRSITVTSGVISTFVPDPLGHVHDPRFELEITARLAHGNSGGAAIDNSGQLIGVPSLAVSGEGGDTSWRLRSVAEARPLIAAARRHMTYQSKLLAQPTGVEQVTGAGVGVTAQQACTGGQQTAPASSATNFGVGYANFPQGLDIAMLIRLPDGTAVPGQQGGLPQATASAGSGCFAYHLTASELGLASLPEGRYQVELFAGPNLAPVGAPAGLDIGGTGRPPAQPPSQPRSG